MPKTLYLDGKTGISGNMLVAALLDLGASREKLDRAIESLHIEGLHYHLERKNSYSVAGLSFQVFVHDHDADKTESREEHYAEHAHDAHHESGHDHGHSHHEHSHEHVHRHPAEIFALIDRADTTPTARATAHKIFDIIAEAEAQAHGVPKESVHFHEVGAIDSIIDVLAIAVLADDLQISDCIVTELAEGSGEVRTQHGMLPVPVPAVLNIATAHEIALSRENVHGEMVTPTGIAAVAALRTSETLPQSYKVRKVGIGLGQRDFGKANFLRAAIIEPAARQGSIWILESNIDDSTPEELGVAMDQLFAAGALDASFIPCQMKKNRPGTLVKIVAAEENLAAIERALFENTTTIGIRKYPVERSVMQREQISVHTVFGEISVKKCTWQDLTRFYPECENVKQAQTSAAQNGTPASFREIYRAAVTAAEQKR